MIKKIIISCTVLVFATGALAGITADFDNLTLSADSHWDGEDNWDGVYPATPADSPKTYNDTFSSGSMTFNNQFQAWTGGEEPPYWNYTSWSGWAYSNQTDNSAGGSSHEYDVMTGSAYSGDNFGVAYYGWGGVTPTVTLDDAATPGTTQITNTAYAYYSMLNGDFFADPMAAGDWFKVTITGKDIGGQETGAIDVYLGDFRNGATTIVNTWQEVDLSGLGTVKTMEFVVSSWDDSVSAAGNWPNYLAMDSTVPEPATMTLIGLGGLVALLRRRRRVA